MDPEMPWLERSPNFPAEASCMLIVHITRWKDVWVPCRDPKKALGLHFISKMGLPCLWQLESHDGWHNGLNGHEWEEAPGMGDGQGSLACGSPRGHKESDTTEWLNWTDLQWTVFCQNSSLWPPSWVVLHDTALASLNYASPLAMIRLRFRNGVLWICFRKRRQLCSMST